MITIAPFILPAYSLSLGEDARVAEPAGADIVNTGSAFLDAKDDATAVRTFREITRN